LTRLLTTPPHGHDAWWRAQNTGSASVSHTVTLRGTRIHYRSWSDQKGPLLLFVHGFRGHTHWWDWIAPSFAGHYDVVALDLSGMGDSEWRAVYEEDCFARDVLELVEHLDRPATVIGHSFGGTQLLRASAIDAASARPRIRHGIVVDTWVRVRGEAPHAPSSRARETGPYPDFETAFSRFRLNPRQAVADPGMLEHIARHSVRRHDGLWHWKFDPHLQAAFIQNPHALLQRIRIPVDIVHGGLSSIMTRERADACVEVLPHGRGPVTIPGAHHHMMFDQPIALVATLRALLADRK
jgi:pimeloyl-ACP methyl ester carboxylesterase